MRACPAQRRRTEPLSLFGNVFVAGHTGPPVNGGTEAGSGPVRRSGPALLHRGPFQAWPLDPGAPEAGDTTGSASALLRSPRPTALACCLHQERQSGRGPR